MCTNALVKYRITTVVIKEVTYTWKISTSLYIFCDFLLAFHGRGGEGEGRGEASLTFDMIQTCSGWNFYDPTILSYIPQIPNYIHIIHMFVCKKAPYSYTTRISWLFIYFMSFYFRSRFKFLSLSLSLSLCVCVCVCVCVAWCSNLMSQCYLSYWFLLLGEKQIRRLFTYRAGRK